MANTSRRSGRQSTSGPTQRELRAALEAAGQLSLPLAGEGLSISDLAAPPSRVTHPVTRRPKETP